MKNAAFFRTLLASVAVLALLAVPSAFAGNVTWNGTTGNGVWSSGNFVGGVAPTNLDTAVFSSANGTQAIAIGTATLNVGGFAFNNTGTTGINTGGTAAGGVNTNITIGSAGITVDAAAGAVTFGTTGTGGRVATTINGTQTWMNNGTLSFVSTTGGAFALGANTLTIDGSGTTSIAGAISGTAGTGKIAKNGTGTLRLSGANTFTGGLTLNSGILTLGGNAALGGAANILTINGGTIDVTAARTTTNNNAQNWNGDFTFGGTNTWDTGTGAVTMNASRTVTVTGSTMTVSGAIGGVGFGLTKEGAGTLTLNATNTYSGGTTVNAGTLAPTLATALPGYNALGQVVFNGGTIATKIGDGSTTGWSTAQVDALLGNATKTSGAIGLDTTNGNITQWTAFTTSNFGALGLTKLGTGNLTLDQANTYTGGTTVNAGTLQIGNGGATGSLSTSSAISNNATLVFSRNNTITQGTDFANVISGTGSVVQNGSGTLVLNGINTYSGGTTLSTGILSIENTSALGTGALTFNGAGSVNLNTAHTAISSMVFTGATSSQTIGTGGPNNLLLASGGSITVTNNTTLTASNATIAINAPLEIQNAVGTGSGVYSIINNSENGTGAGTATLNIGGAISGVATTGNITTLTLKGNANVVNRLNPNTISGQITDGTAGGKLALNVGAGLTVSAWTLTGTNTFTGNITLVSGGSILSVASDANLGAGTSIEIQQNSKLQTTASFATSKNIVFQGGNPHLQAQSGTTLTLNGAVTTNGTAGPSSVPIRIDGGGNVVLNNGGNAFSANGSVVAVENGSTLSLGNAGALTGATLKMNEASTKLDNTSGSSLVMTGLSGFDIQTNFTFLGSNDLNLSGAGSTGFIGTANATRTITVTNNTLTLGGILTTGTDGAGYSRVNGALSKSGNGTLVLAGASDYTLGTSVIGGTLSLNSAGGALADTGAVTVNGGTLDVAQSDTIGDLLVNGSGSIVSGVGTLTAASYQINTAVGNTGTISAALAGSGAFSKTGLGKGILTGTNTYTGNTTITSGTLQIGNGGSTGSLSTSSAIINDSTLVFSRNNTVTQGTDFATAISGNGSVTQAGTGNLVLAAGNTYTGSTTVNGGGTGSVTISADSALGTAPGVATAGSLVLNDGGLVTTGTMVIDSNRGILLSGTAGGQINVVSGTTTYGGIIAGSKALQKSGTGVLLLTGANSYTGATQISAGTLIVNGSTNASSAVSIENGGTLGGGGIVNGSVTVNSGGTLSPGNSPGLLTQGATTLEGGGNYNWQIVDALGSAGTGYDLITLLAGSTLTLNNTSGNKFNINLWSLSSISPDVNGNANFFNPAVSQSWTLFSTDQTISGFDANAFAVNVGAINGTGGFTNALAGGTFSVSLGDSNTDLMLNFTAVPEPAAWMLAALGLTVTVVFRRRRQN